MANIIGTGAQGFVVHPPYKSVDEEIQSLYGNERYVMKITDTVIHNEILCKLCEIDPNCVYFIYALKYTQAIIPLRSRHKFN